MMDKGTNPMRDTIINILALIKSNKGKQQFAAVPTSAQVSTDYLQYWSSLPTREN